MDFVSAGVHRGPSEGVPRPFRGHFRGLPGGSGGIIILRSRWLSHPRYERALVPPQRGSANTSTAHGCRAIVPVAMQGYARLEVSRCHARGCTCEHVCRVGNRTHTHTYTKAFHPRSPCVLPSHTRASTPSTGAKGRPNGTRAAGAMGAEGECGPEWRPLSAGVLAAGGGLAGFVHAPAVRARPATAVVEPASRGLRSARPRPSVPLPCPAVPATPHGCRVCGMGAVASEAFRGLPRPLPRPLYRMNTGFAPLGRHSPFALGRSLVRLADHGRGKRPPGGSHRGGHTRGERPPGRCQRWAHAVRSSQLDQPWATSSAAPVRRLRFLCRSRGSVRRDGDDGDAMDTCCRKSSLRTRARQRSLECAQLRDDARASRGAPTRLPEPSALLKSRATPP